MAGTTLSSPTPAPSCLSCQSRIQVASRWQCRRCQRPRLPLSLALLSLIVSLLSHGHKKVATDASITSSSNHSERRSGLASTIIYHHLSWITCYSTLNVSMGNGIMPGSDQTCLPQIRCHLNNLVVLQTKQEGRTMHIIFHCLCDCQREFSTYNLCPRPHWLVHKNWFLGD